MDLRLRENGAAGWRADAFILPLFEGEGIPANCPGLAEAVPGLANAPGLADFRGRRDELAVLYASSGAQAVRLILSGLGKRDQFDLQALRLAIAAGVRKAQGLGLSSMLLPAPLLALMPGGYLRLLEESVFAALLGAYNFNCLKKSTQDSPGVPDFFDLGFAQSPDDAVSAAVEQGRSAARAVCLARDLENMPPNLLYPDTLAQRAGALAGEYGLKCQILDESVLSELGMGALLAVGRGSGHPPRLVILEHQGESAQEAPLLLVGKGLTFDSGGICLKPAANMGQMKCDMSGAAACLAAITAMAEQRMKRRVVALLALAENMPDGRAQRPGDVVRSYAGDTVEIVNTDAEGRMVLCDALAYGCREFAPRAIVDIATLTGACAVALGSQLAGLFCADEAFCSKLLALSASLGENMWRMPLWEPYKENLKSEIADISHTGPREGGAITAALFLAHFVDSHIPYAHMDIAGVDWNAAKNPLCPVGATGFGTRTLLELGREEKE